jgi:hypothetical protein
VQHVGVGQDVVGLLPHPGALLEGRVAVEGGRPHLGDAQLTQSAQLVGGQRLGRREIEDGAALEGGGDGGNEVGERLPRRRACGNDHVSATSGQVCRFVLVRPQSGDSSVRQARNQKLADPVRPSHLTRLTCGNMLHVGHALVACGNAEQVLEEWTDSVRGGSGGTHWFPV